MRIRHTALIRWMSFSKRMNCIRQEGKRITKYGSAEGKWRADALENVAELYPWRVPGNRGSYSHYNEGWCDAIGRAEIGIEELPSAQPEDWMERNKERILQAGMEGREIEFRIGGRLFAIREKAQ